MCFCVLDLAIYKYNGEDESRRHRHLSWGLTFSINKGSIGPQLMGLWTSVNIFATSKLNFETMIDMWFLPTYIKFERTLPSLVSNHVPSTQLFDKNKDFFTTIEQMQEIQLAPFNTQFSGSKVFDKDLCSVRHQYCICQIDPQVTNIDKREKSID